MQNQNASHLVRAVETEKSENAISKLNPSRDAELETLRSQGSQNASSLLSCTSKFIAIKGWKRAWVYLASYATTYRFNIFVYSRRWNSHHESR